MAIYGSNFDYGQSPFYKDDGGDIIAQGTCFQYLPNWNYPVQLSYNFETIISMTRLFYEQRKGLRSTPIRKHVFSITEKDVYEKIWNYFEYRHAESFMVPIFTEPLRVQGSGLMTGAIIFGVTDFLYYYNLRKLTAYCMLIDPRDDVGVGSELVQLTGLTGHDVVNCSPIVKSFQRENTYMFPTFRAYLTSKNRQEITDRMTLMNFEFTEVLEDV